MKPALLEVMRMNRICRMVLATCLGSFILVIFYFQSMLHPGRGRVSVVLLDIFLLSRSAFCFFQPHLFPSASSGLLAAGIRGSPSWDGQREGALPLPLQAPGWRLRPQGKTACVAPVFLSLLLLLFFSLCLVCWLGGRER